MQTPYLILEYYVYTKIDNPVAFREQHHAYALSLNLRGRIKVAAEGLNGTISGLKADCERYLADLKSDPRFADAYVEVTPSPTLVHAKLHVRLKREIVHSSLVDMAPSPEKEKRHYIDSTTFRRMMHDPNVVVLDVRSNYEHRLGKFKNSLTLDITNFREFPKKLSAMNLDKSKTYITVCTGGIKSEKARDYLKEVLNIPNVYQLDGGVLGYGKTTDGEDFQGVCYVFDQRVTIPINRKNPTTICHCHLCGIPSNRMVNCANAVCNLHIALCPDCAEKNLGACSDPCKEAEHTRQYDGTGYYLKQSNGYNPYLGSKRMMSYEW